MGRCYGQALEAKPASDYRSTRIETLMTAIPNLYLKWRAFRELADVKDADNWIGKEVFRTEDPSDGAQRFSKLLRGDLGCSQAVGENLTHFMNDWVTRVRSRADRPASLSHTAALVPADLELPVLAFASRLIAVLGTPAEKNLDRAHRALLRDMTLDASSVSDGPQLVVERYAAGRSFMSARPSGGDGPVVFEAGKDKGQLAIIAADAAPLGAYTFFTRDPAPIGKRLWDLSWGEAVMWLPSPMEPKLVQGRLTLLPRAEPVRPAGGRFIVTCALVWRKEAIERLDPRGKAPVAGIMDEGQTSRFLTNLRRLTEDKFKKWQDAVTVSQAEYVVKVAPASSVD